MPAFQRSNLETALGGINLESPPGSNDDRRSHMHHYGNFFQVLVKSPH